VLNKSETEGNILFVDLLEDFKTLPEGLSEYLDPSIFELIRNNYRRLISSEEIELDVEIQFIGQLPNKLYIA
jgi:hypothetical protein